VNDEHQNGCHFFTKNCNIIENLASLLTSSCRNLAVVKHYNVTIVLYIGMYVVMLRLEVILFFCILGRDARILLWDLATGELACQLHGHSDAIYSLTFSREGTLLASGIPFIFFLQFRFMYQIRFTNLILLTGSLSMQCLPTTSVNSVKDCLNCL
jgi:WD40 repeat protein